MADKNPTDEDECYVGRPTKWGNPFRLSHYSRTAAIIKYNEYFENSQSQFLIDELVGKKLYCHCAPLPCHADILIKKSNKIVIK